MSAPSQSTPVLTSAHFISMISASLVMLTAGSLYVFSLWGTEFANELHLTQFQISFVAAAGNNGLYISAPLVGYLVDHYSRQSHAFLMVGGTLIYAGYGLLNLSFYKHIEAGYILLALFNAMVGVGCACCYGYSLATSN
jgi:MFS family permease